MDVSGPLPPDTVFMRAFKGEFDGVVSMLHDHGFVALKSRDFENGVNITLGCPLSGRRWAMERRLISREKERPRKKV